MIRRDVFDWLEELKTAEKLNLPGMLILVFMRNRLTRRLLRH